MRVLKRELVGPRSDNRSEGENVKTLVVGANRKPNGWKNRAAVAATRRS